MSEPASTLDEDIAEDFALLGVEVDPEAVETPAEDDGVFKVLEANWPAMTAFLACETQWRFAGTMTRLHRTGLDYAAVDVVMRRRGHDDAVLDDIREIERGALKAFAEAPAGDE